MVSETTLANVQTHLLSMDKAQLRLVSATIKQAYAQLESEAASDKKLTAGMHVEFIARGRKVAGFIRKVNYKTVSVEEHKTPGNIIAMRWTVSPSLLTVVPR